MKTKRTHGAYVPSTRDVKKGRWHNLNMTKSHFDIYINGRKISKGEYYGFVNICNRSYAVHWDGFVTEKIPLIHVMHDTGWIPVLLYEDRINLDSIHINDPNGYWELEYSNSDDRDIPFFGIRWVIEDIEE